MSHPVPGHTYGENEYESHSPHKEGGVRPHGKKPHGPMHHTAHYFKKAAKDLGKAIKGGARHKALTKRSGPNLNKETRNFLRSHHLER